MQKMKKRKNARRKLTQNAHFAQAQVSAIMTAYKGGRMCTPRRPQIKTQAAQSARQKGRRK